MRKKSTKPVTRAREAAELIGAVLICQLAGVIGSVFTISAIPTWYATLQKPFFNPPNWLFGPVWTTLYTLMGVAAWLVWRQRGKNRLASPALKWFAAQLALNAAWSIIFFGWQNLWLAFFVLLVLWWLILQTMRRFAVIARAAGWLLVPYLAWVTFAGLLNFSIALLN